MFALTRIKPIFKILILLFVFIVKVPCSQAGTIVSQAHFELKDDTPWQITADSFEYKDNEKRIVAKGEVAIVKEGYSLFAQEATYDKETGIVEVTGSIRFEAGGDILTGEKGFFNLNDRTGRIDKGSLFLKQNHYHIKTDILEKIGENTYYMTNGILTTCDGDTPTWSITCSEMTITIEGYGTAKHAAFRIHQMPVFYLPYMIFPAKTKRQTGLLPPRLGYSDWNGADMEVPFFWAISDQTDTTFYERFMDKRGFMQGFEFRYVAPEDSKGIFLFDVLSDKRDKDMNDPQDLAFSPLPRSNKTRYWFRSKTDQQLPSDIMLRLDLDVVSDQDYLREFYNDLHGFRSRPDIEDTFGRPTEDIRSPFRRSLLRLDYDRADYSVQAQTSYYQRPEDTPSDETPQPLGSLGYSVLPLPLPNIPLFFSLNTEYDYIWRDFGQRGHRGSITPTVSSPMGFGPYLEFEPSFRYTTLFQRFDNNSLVDHQSKDAYDTQIRLATVLEKVIPFERKMVKKLKHKIIPSLTYQYRVPKDDEKEQPWFEPIDLNGKINRITFSLENFLDMRKENNKGDIMYSQWGVFDLSQGYDIEEARRNDSSGIEKTPFEPLKGTLTLKPSSNLNIAANTNWDHYEEDVTFADLSFDLSLSRSEGRKDTYMVDYVYTKNESRFLNYGFHVNLLYRLSAGTSLKRDLARNETVEQNYWVEYTSQCWGVRLTVEEDENDTSVMVTFNFLGLGDISSK